MFRRKIENYLKEWKSDENKMPLVIKGCRQCGKMNRKLYYFRKDSGLEIDFVTRYKRECTLVEVKANNGNIKSTKTLLAHPEKYHVSHAIKLGDVNVGTAPQTLILPLYMAFLLR